MKAAIAILLLATFVTCDEYHPRPKVQVKRTFASSEGKEYWTSKGKDEIDFAKKTRAELIENKAKNVIIFIGDGMSLPTLTAARIYKAQKLDNWKGNVKGEETLLHFEQFPHIGLSKVRLK